MQLFLTNILIFNFLISPTCFEPEGSSSGRRLGCNFSTYNILYHTCTYNRHPEDEPTGSKHVEGIKKSKIKILIQKGEFYWVILGLGGETGGKETSGET